MKKYVKIKHFVELLSEMKKANMVKLNQYIKSDKPSCITYGNLESLMKKVDNCKINPKKFSTTKISEHIPCGYSISTIWAFGKIENKHSLCRGEDNERKLCFSKKACGRCN